MTRADRRLRLLLDTQRGLSLALEGARELALGGEPEDVARYALLATMAREVDVEAAKALEAVSAEALADLVLG